MKSIEEIKQKIDNLQIQKKQLSDKETAENKIDIANEIKSIDERIQELSWMLSEENSTIELSELHKNGFNYEFG